MRRFLNEFAYLISGPAAAAAWFGLLLAGWLTALLLAVTPLVVPVLIAFRWATRVLAVAEAGLARGLLGAEVRVGRAAGTEKGYLPRIRGILSDRGFWRQQGYGVIRMVGGFATGVAAASAVASSLFLVGLPIYYRWVDTWQVHSRGRAFAAVPVGLAALAVSVLLVHGLARIWALLAPALLGAGGPEPAGSAAAGRGGLREHLAGYALVNAICVVVWAATSRAYFWPMWPLLSFGLPLAVHGLVVRARRVPRRWRAVTIHAGTSAAIAVFLVAIWAVTTRGYFWPVWPISGFILAAGGARGADRCARDEPGGCGRGGGG